ncbi:MAG: YfcE family phosphodiesterase [Candidatus Solibacter sp.]|nr:YfcE family phosphodiesterase [Candidatus Solibacter sp.]
MSDTHDHIANIAAVVGYFAQRQAALVIHCGDWVSPFSLEYYKGLPCKIMGVFGNNDGDPVRHVQYAGKFGIAITIQDRFLAFESFGRRIAIYHGDHNEITEALVASGKYDLVCHGHNHSPAIERFGNTLSLNPGTLVPLDKEGFPGPSIAVYDPGGHRAVLLRVGDLLNAGDDPLRFGAGS